MAGSLPGAMMFCSGMSVHEQMIRRTCRHLDEYDDMLVVVSKPQNGMTDDGETLWL